MRRKVFVIPVLLALVLFPFVSARTVEAARFTEVVLRFDRMQINTNDVNVVVMIQPTGTGDEDYIDIDFAAGIGVDESAVNITTNTSNLPNGCTALGVGSNASNVSGQSVEFAISSPGNPTTGTLYCFNITGGIDSPSSIGSYVNTVRSEDLNHSEIESSDVTTYFVTNDQISVSAVVPPTFTFDLGANTTSFTSDLSVSSVVSTTGVTGGVVTNASNGWTAYLQSANGSLDSVIAGDSIETQGSIDNAVTTLINGSEFYQLDVDETADNQGNGSIDAEYDGGANEGGTFNSSALEPIATGTGSTDSYIFTMVGKATISGLTEAGDDYTDTWTVVAGGNF